MAGWIKKWTEEGMSENNISIYVATWMGTSSDRDAEGEAEALIIHEKMESECAEPSKTRTLPIGQ